MPFEQIDLRSSMDGDAVCNVVDVNNLCHAIELALAEMHDRAERFFVTDDEPVTWRNVVTPLPNWPSEGHR